MIKLTDAFKIKSICLKYIFMKFLTKVFAVK